MHARTRNYKKQPPTYPKIRYIGGYSHSILPIIRLLLSLACSYLTSFLFGGLLLFLLRGNGVVYLFR